MPMPTPARRSSSTRRRKRSRWLRWIGAVVLLAIAAGYVQPLRAYRDARADVETQRAELREVARENGRLERRLVEAGTDAFVEREARKLRLIRPGERLFIVTGVDEWKAERQRRAKARLR
jgi:cell division protein FtsB